MTAPVLSGDALAAVRHRGSHLQIIASTGSGKIEIDLSAVAELETPAVADTVHATLRHLIVNEYQDVNPAQERLIRLLTVSEVELCVVGDDDQAIY